MTAVVSPGQGYRLGGVEYDSFDDLARGMLDEWLLAARHIKRGYLAEWVNDTALTTAFEEASELPAAAAVLTAVHHLNASLFPALAGYRLDSAGLSRLATTAQRGDEQARLLITHLADENALATVAQTFSLPELSAIATSWGEHRAEYERTLQHFARGDDQRAEAIERLREISGNDDRVLAETLCAAVGQTPTLERSPQDVVADARRAPWFDQSLLRGRIGEQLAARVALPLAAENGADIRARRDHSTAERRMIVGEMARRLAIVAVVIAVCVVGWPVVDGALSDGLPRLSTNDGTTATSRQAGPQTYVVSAKRAVVRKKPRPNAPVVKRIRKGTVVTGGRRVVENGRVWRRISNGKKLKGWIRVNHIDEIEKK